uniref:Sugar phosphate transporter domain-containing protein n=1 Tax=Arcella intermedia TaxID=1963864 RepID=A0A6B2LAE2_9EUKA
MLLLAWFSSAFVISATSKQILSLLPFPGTITLIQLVTKTLCCKLSMWGLHSSSPPLFSFKLLDLNNIFSKSESVMTSILFIGLLRMIAKFLSELSLIYIHVSLTTIISISAPVATLILAYHINGERATWKQFVSILPILVGVFICSYKDSEADPMGVTFSFISVIFFCLSNIFTKKLLQNQPIPHLTLAYYSDITSILFTLPLFLLFEMTSIPENLSVISQSSMFLGLLVNGLGTFVHTMVTFQILSRSASVTYSLQGILKKMVVTFGSVLYFGNGISLWTMFGIFLSFLGILLHTWVTIKPSQKKD